MGHHPAKRPARPEAADRADHQGRPTASQGFLSDTEPVQDAGTERLDHRVRGVHQLQEDLPALFGLQVYHHRTFSPVDNVMRRALPAYLDPEGAHVIPRTGILHLDHFRTQGGKQPGAVVARQQPGQVEDAYARERGIHRRFLTI